MLHRTALAGCLLFVAGILAGVEIGLASTVALALVLVGFVVRSPATLRPGLVPLRLLLFVTGLFLVVQTLGRHGLDDLVRRPARRRRWRARGAARRRHRSAAGQRA